MTMNESKPVTKDPICGMTVDEATALHARRRQAGGEIWRRNLEAAADNTQAAQAK